MSLKLSENIESVKHSTDELAKIYVGEDLVFEHDKPVWFIRLSKAFKYSLDGKTYNTLYSYSSNDDFASGHFIKDRFLFAGDNYTKLSSFKPQEVANGVYNWIDINTPITYGFSSMTTNGNDIIVASDRYTSNKKVFYSLNGGQDWNSTSVGESAFNIAYIGNNRFYLQLDKAKESANLGKYYYWTSTNPGTYYVIQYKLPNGNNATTAIENVQIDNQGVVYVQTNNKIYYGTYNQAEGELSGITPSSNVKDSFRFPVYIYGKHYAVLNSRVYVSTNGTSYSVLSTYTGSAYKLMKTDGKLAFIGSRRAGIINEDGTAEYTTFTSSEAEYDNMSSFDYNFVCNRFPRI